MSQVVVIGANGQLGSDLCREFESSADRLIALTRDDIDIRDHERAAVVLEGLKPSVIVNTAAFHKVEACETDVNQAFQVNCIAVRNLADAPPSSLSKRSSCATRASRLPLTRSA